MVYTIHNIPEGSKSQGVPKGSNPSGVPVHCRFMFVVGVVVELVVIVDVAIMM